MPDYQRADQNERRSGDFWEVSPQQGCGLSLATRLSTDEEGIAACLDLKAEPKVGLEAIIQQLEAKITPQTLLSI